MTQEITGIFHHAENLLKQIGKLGDEAKISQAERAVRQNMQRSVAKKLQGLSSTFRQSQKVCMSVTLSIRALIYWLYLLLNIYCCMYYNIEIFNKFTKSKTRIWCPSIWFLIWIEEIISARSRQWFHCCSNASIGWSRRGNYIYTLTNYITIDYNICNMKYSSLIKEMKKSLRLQNLLKSLLPFLRNWQY